MNMLRIQSRWALTALIAAGQIVLLLVAAVWVSGWLDRSMTGLVRERESVALLRTASTVASILNANVGTQEVSAEQARSAVQAVDPLGGAICVIDDADGSVLAHHGAALSRDDTEIEWADVLVPMRSAGPEGEPVFRRLLDVRGLELASSVVTVELDGEAHLAAIRPVTARNVRVVALQPAWRISALAAAPIANARFVVVAIIGVLGLASVVMTSLFVYRYESHLRNANRDLEHLVDRRSKALLKSRSAVIMGLAKLAESRDGETGQHLERIRAYVRILGEELVRTHDEVDESFVDVLEETCVLHDIGKVGVPDVVLRHPNVLNEEQRSIIEKHPLIGGDTLLEVKRRWGDDPFLVTACEVCFAHHERWDGTGYPFGLSGDIIPISARIVALADVYDALTSKRQYKSAMTHDEARDLIVAGAGTHFDPDIVDAFVATEHLFRQAFERLSTTN